MSWFSDLVLWGISRAGDTPLTPRRQVTNFIPGAGISIGVQDNPALERSDVTIALDGATGVVPYSEISPAALSASVNDYAPAGLAAASVVRQDATAAWTVTGLNATGWTVKQKEYVNVSAFPVTLAHQSASSSAANRFLNESGADFVLAPNASVWLYLDSTTGRIRVANSLRPAPIAHGNSGSAITIDLSQAVHHTLVVNANTTITFLLPAVNRDICDVAITFSGGAHTVAYAVTGGSPKYSGGAAPTLDTSGKSQTLILQRNGTDLEIQATPAFS